ncbi:MAG: NACHT domain-containing protein [Peptococcaceae bacterium]|nr:NACHT domain-containing protein [Peptococcaceae bacterium]
MKKLAIILPILAALATLTGVDILKIVGYIISNRTTIDVRESLTGIVVIAILASLGYALGKLFQDNSVMKKHRGKLSASLHGNDFKRKRTAFCNSLQSDIETMDLREGWKDYYFTQLEARVVVKKKYHQEKTTISNLMSALKKMSRDNTVIIVGPPGSGKSTILRKLAKDLLKEVDKTDKIPLYIDLKHWNINTTSLLTDHAPTGAQIPLAYLLDFIKETLTARLGGEGSPGSSFLEEYFRELYRQGCFYFIFDAYDEIPALLDEPKPSRFADEISSLLYNLCSHGRNTRIILSTSELRQPAETFRTQTKMSIQPLKDLRLCLTKHQGTTKLASKLYSEHRTLMNRKPYPFHAKLLVQYYNHTKSLPKYETDLFDHFVRTQLENNTHSLREGSIRDSAYRDNAHRDNAHRDSAFRDSAFRDSALRDDALHDDAIRDSSFRDSVAISELRYYAQKTARALFAQKHKRDIPYQALVDTGIPEHILTSLTESGLVRIGSGAKRAVSFVHRGVLEYFVANEFMTEDLTREQFTYIFTDPLWRDTLAMYAQMCSDDKAHDLAEFCCSFLTTIDIIEKPLRAQGSKKLSTRLTRLAEYLNIPTQTNRRIEENDKFRQAEHALMFLVDAFSNRPEALLPFEEVVTEMAALLLDENRFINKKYHEIALQTVPILPADKQSLLLEKVLTKNIPWINEAAIQNCAHLKTITPNMFLKIIRYFAFMDSTTFIKNLKRNLFNIFHVALSPKIKGIYIFQSTLMALSVIVVLTAGIFSALDSARYLSYIEFIIILILAGILKLAFSWIFRKGVPNELGVLYNVIDFSSILLSYSLLLIYIGVFCLVKGQIGLGLMCLLFPTNFCAYFFAVIWLRLRFKRVLVEYYRLIISASIVILTYVCLIILWRTLVIRLPILLAPPILLILGLLLHSLYQSLINHWQDRKRFRTFAVSQTTDRGNTTEMLEGLLTARYQKKYLKLLRERETDFPAK